MTEFNSNNGNYRADAILVIKAHNDARFKLKVTMSTKEQAERVNVTGSMIGGMLVESHNIQRERVDNVAQCY